MNRKFVARLSAGVLFLMIGWIAYTQNQTAPPKLVINKVKDDLFEIENDGGNIGVYVTNEGVILIDDKFDRDHEQIMDLVKSVTNEPIKYVINTHYHEDHSGGNIKMYGMGVEIISTNTSRKNILEHKQSNASALVQPARIAFDHDMSVVLGGKEVQAHFLGRGHTGGDAAIYFPALRTVHTGDLMAGTSPLIDYSGGGSLVDWPKTLDEVMKLDFDTVIPGHGPVTTKAGLKTYRDNVVALRDRVTGMVRGGKSQAEVAKFMETEYKWAPGSLQQLWSVPGFMTELK